MEIIHYLFTFLCVISFILLIIGLINPKIALFFLKKYQNRLTVSILYLILGILFGYLSDMTLTKEMKKEMLVLKRKYEIEDSLKVIQQEKKLLEEEQNKQNKIVSNSELDGSVSQVEEYLKSSLKDPDSYESIEWSPVSIVETETHKFIVRHKYRAKNGFGGYVISNQSFYLDKDGNVVKVMDWK
jgi:hypothetical protein